MDAKPLTVLALDVPGATCKDLAGLLGLGPEAVVGPFKSSMFLANERWPTLFKINVHTRDEIMTIFKKHNFTRFKESHLRLQLWPPSVYNKVPDIQIQSNVDIALWEIYENCQQFGFVVTVIPLAPGRDKYGVYYKYQVAYNTKESAQLAFTEIDRKRKLGSYYVVASLSRSNSSLPDFWASLKTPEKPEKVKGNLIDVPTNNVHPAQSKIKVQAPAGKGGHHNPHNLPTKPKKRVLGSAEEQRIIKSMAKISNEELRLQPGEIRGAICKPHRRNYPKSMASWCETAFICYETLHNLSSDSNQGTVQTSTLTWGSQLDISTFRMHYGSIFTPSDSTRQYPILSSLTVEMRQYGDKDSAAGVLAIRNNRQLPDSCDSSLTEGINVTTRAPILSMKCLESGHLVASSGSSSTDYILQVWDMRDEREKAEVPVAMLKRKTSRNKLWFDVQRMDICSVDVYGTICAYDLYSAVSSGQHTTTAQVDHTTMADIDREYSFHSSCISVNGADSTVLVGSSEHAQIARWDPRSPKDAFTSMACRVPGSFSYQRRCYEPIYDVAWNPRNTNEFMTIHAHSIRVWDARKIDHDGCATFHSFEQKMLRKARWSPHHSDCIATLATDGQLKIWKINKFDNYADTREGVQQPELLFNHQAHELIVSDFSWCPYDEDVIATVAPGIDQIAGNIQVWRPRNLYDSDVNGEP